MLTDRSTLDTSGLSMEERKQILSMIHSLEKDEDYKVLFLEPKYCDTQAVFIDKEFPINFDGRNLTIPVKCKFDWWQKLIGFGGDLKSTQARTQEQFISAAKWFNYPQQAAWYMDITRTDRFIIFAVSKWNYKVFKMSFRRGDDAYKAGKIKYLSDSADWWKLYGSHAA